MIRPLFTAILEYSLMIFVLSKGKIHPKTFAAVLFFLASYQFGEFLIFFTKGDRVGLQVAYLSTTLLPPLGLLLVQKITKRNFGYIFFQIIAIVFAGLFVLRNSEMIHSFEMGSYCIKITNYGSHLSTYWAFYYLSTIGYTMLIMIGYLLTSSSKKIKSTFTKMLLAYSSFFLVTLLIIVIFPEQRVRAASMMCALAVFASLIFAYISLDREILKKYIKEVKVS